MRALGPRGQRPKGRAQRMCDKCFEPAIFQLNKYLNYSNKSFLYFFKKNNQFPFFKNNHTNKSGLKTMLILKNAQIGLKPCGKDASRCEGFDGFADFSVRPLCDEF